MALHQSDNRHLGTSLFGSVLKEGYSFDLGLSQTGIFSKSGKKATKRGLKALSSFQGLDKNLEKLSVLFGTKGDSGRFGSDKNSRTMDFTLSEIKKVGISHPKQTEQKFDYWRVGWDGINDETTLKFMKGQTVEFGMTIGGMPVTLFNSDSEYTVKVPVSIPGAEQVTTCEELDGLCDPVDCREHTLKMVKDLNNYSLPSGFKLSEFFDIYPIFSAPSNPTKEIVYKQWCLKYCGFGGTNELDAVSSQYPGVKVTRDTMSGEFVIFAPESYTPSAFKRGKDAILKGCKDCPSGYDEVEKGFVYAVAIEDDGEDKKSVVEGLANAVSGTAVKTGNDFGIGHYSVILSKQLKADKEKEFIDSNPTAKVLFVGTKEAFCKNDVEETFAWTECGTCKATEATYRILIADDCKGDRLEDLKVAYPDLTITKVKSQNCVSLYETKVMTSFSCSEGCNNDIIQQVFTSEAPKHFGLNAYWFPYNAEQVADTSVKCGFEIKAKPVVMSPSDCTIDSLPFINTSTRIVSLAGGYPLDYSMNSFVPEGTWRVLQLERAQDLDNLFGDLRQWQQKGLFYFLDERPTYGVVERELTGTEVKGDSLKQASDLFFTIEGSNKSGINDKSYTYITYHILVPYGKSEELEKLFANLAGGAGVPFEVK